ncbi:MAG: hypothetical protein MRERC_1c072 [Mycoplasmataceae bacterium RC_NB112A]|nr:MAG: hypothetical protein MRERC_1c072 [Mycoplasmataceae bacterium RC_NB112A]
MPRNVNCDQCNKSIGNENLAWFNCASHDLDFCSESCCEKWLRRFSPYRSLEAKYSNLIDRFNELSKISADSAEKILNDGKENYSKLWSEYSKNVDDYNNLVNNSVRKEAFERLENDYKQNIKDYNELVGERRELVERTRNLQNQYNDLSDRFNDINTKYEEMKDKYEDTRDTRESERVNNARNSTRLQERLEASNADRLDLRRRLTNVENEKDRLLLRLDERSLVHSQRVENLNNQLTTLRLESGEKESKLREQAEEIKRLKKNLGTTQRDAADEKLQFKQEKLETLATQLGIQLRRIENLRRRFKELIIAQENNNNNNANVAQENITAVKETLQTTLQGDRTTVINNIQRICKKCRKLAQLELQLEQARQQQQYEARQEVPPRNN